MKKRIRSYSRKSNGKRVRVKSYVKECPGSKIRSKGRGRGLGIGQGRGPIGSWSFRSSPPRLYSEQRVSEMSEQEVEDLKKIMFPQREPVRARGRIRSTAADRITSDQKVILDQYETALWAKDKDALKFLKPQVEAILK